MLEFDILWRFWRGTCNHNLSNDNDSFLFFFFVISVFRKGWSLELSGEDFSIVVWFDFREEKNREEKPDAEV
jgi:hypothetical protein